MTPHYTAATEWTCGQLYGSLSLSGHPCSRLHTHAFDDEFGHVCRCEADAFLETHTECGPSRRHHPQEST